MSLRTFAAAGGHMGPPLQRAVKTNRRTYVYLWWLTSGERLWRVMKGYEGLWTVRTTLHSINPLLLRYLCLNYEGWRVFDNILPRYQYLVNLLLPSTICVRRLLTYIRSFRTYIRNFRTYIRSLRTYIRSLLTYHSQLIIFVKRIIVTSKWC